MENAHVKPLRELRAEHMLSQQELADKAAVSKKTIVDIENGEVERPQWRTVRALSKALGVKPGEIGEFALRLSGDDLAKIAA